MGRVRTCEACGTALVARSPGELKKRKFCSLACVGLGLRRKPRRTAIEPDRFWEKVHIRLPDECWEWQASLTTTGYGQFMTPMRVPVSASRIAYLLAYGPVEHGLYILHTCDNRLCCNPRHLYAGTPKQNMIDVRDRMPARWSLTHEAAEEIRASSEPSDVLAERWGVSRSCINRVRSGATWYRKDAA